MREFRGIPVVSTGSKYRTEHGHPAIKNGVKHRRDRQQLPSPVKPPWLKARIAGGSAYQTTKEIVTRHELATVCQESMCPNIGECWANGTATIMLMGAVCTRSCQFCAVDTGNPNGRLDAREIEHAARSVLLMGLKYVVLTSVDRDDLRDGGAAHFAACIEAIKRASPDTVVEALTPDFRGSEDGIDTVLASGVDVFAHNVETVQRLTHVVRDPRAGYRQSLKVLQYAKSSRSDVKTKTSLMVGIGETDAEIRQTLREVKDASVDIVTLGQYLRPTMNHLPVERYVTPQRFQQFRRWGLELGFIEVVAGPLVRSSYRADRVFQRNNVGL